MSEKYGNFKYMAMSYHDFDFVANDINENTLKGLGYGYEIEHLGDSTFPEPAFPTNGIIHGLNSRYMIPLVVRSYNEPDSRSVTVWFLVNTGSPFTCLTVKTLEALFGAGNVVDQDIDRTVCSNCEKSTNAFDSWANNTFYPVAIQVCFSRDTKTNTWYF